MVPPLRVDVVLHPRGLQTTSRSPWCTVKLARPPRADTGDDGLYVGAGKDDAGHSPAFPVSPGLPRGERSRQNGHAGLGPAAAGAGASCRAGGGARILPGRVGCMAAVELDDVAGVGARVGDRLRRTAGLRASPRRRQDREAPPLDPPVVTASRPASSGAVKSGRVRTSECRAVHTVTPSTTRSRRACRARAMVPVSAGAGDDDLASIGSNR